MTVNYNWQAVSYTVLV